MSLQVPFSDLGASARAVWPEVEETLSRTILSGSYIGGQAVSDFEREWAEYCGTKHAVGVANGTDALLLILEALGIGEGDEVVLPANTFFATAEAVVRAGAVPRFADVSPDTLLLTPQTLHAALTPRTRAVIVVHLFGQMPDMPALQEVADRAGIVLLEDAAQAHGAQWLGRPAGSYGLAASFSFYPGKNSPRRSGPWATTGGRRGGPGITGCSGRTAGWTPSRPSSCPPSSVTTSGGPRSGWSGRPSTRTT
jgi:dTDP-4-amino-4,6-dideoxygalactose transaminase